MQILNLVDISDIFQFFPLGWGEWGSRRQKGGEGRSDFYWKLLLGGRGGVCQERGRGGAEGPGGCLQGTIMGGGGLNIFLGGREIPTYKTCADPQAHNRASLHENERY